MTDNLKPLPETGEFSEEEIEQENAPSYGTGVHDQSQSDATAMLLNQIQHPDESDQVLTGGDVDADWEQASAVGDEAVGGTAPTPDMDVVDELGKAVGLEMDDRAFLRTNQILEGRDDRRWELDPESAEDYSEHSA